MATALWFSAAGDRRLKLLGQTLTLGRFELGEARLRGGVIQEVSGNASAGADPLLDQILDDFMARVRDMLRFRHRSTPLSYRIDNFECWFESLVWQG
jgi:hypothetical protein